MDALGPAIIAALVSISFELRFSLTRKGKVAMLEGIPRC